MFFFVLARDWVLVSEDEMDFIRCAAFIGTEHDRIWRLIGEFFRLDSLRRFGQKFEIGTTAFKTILEFHFVSIISWGQRWDITGPRGFCRYYRGGIRIEQR